MSGLDPQPPFREQIRNEPREQDLQKQNHEERLRGRVAHLCGSWIPIQYWHRYFFLVVFFAFFAGAFFVAIIHHPLSFVEFRNKIAG